MIAPDPNTTVRHYLEPPPAPPVVKHFLTTAQPPATDRDWATPLALALCCACLWLFIWTLPTSQPEATPITTRAASR